MLEAWLEVRPPPGMERVLAAVAVRDPSVLSAFLLLHMTFLEGGTAALEANPEHADFQRALERWYLAFETYKRSMGQFRAALSER